MKAQHFEEPLLEFGTGKHIDVRFGIAQHGPFDVSQATAPTHIKAGLLGSARSIEELTAWLEKAASGVPGKTSRRVNFHPSFPGFSEDTCFGSQLVTDQRWTGVLAQTDIETLISLPPPKLVPSAVDLFVQLGEDILGENSLDVLICAPPPDLMQRLDEVISTTPVNSDKAIDEGSDGDKSDDSSAVPFHDLLKAQAMRLGVPLQMVRPPTYDGQTKSPTKNAVFWQRGMSLQDEATRAWNFFTALYYKAGGIPWRLVRDPASFTSCYAGISFFKSLDGERVLTSVAQVFNERGEGIIVRGADAQKTEVDRQPHLSGHDAHQLVATAISTYRQEHRHTPARLVVHKTSKYADEEQSGVLQAAAEQNIELVDLVAVDRSSTRLFRSGANPPLRGTFLELSAKKAILYLRGSVGFFEMYPGMYVPRPLEMTVATSESTKHMLATEMLALSKLNWNNTQFDGGEPITVRAARQVGDILKCVTSESGTLQRGFRFYM